MKLKKIVVGLLLVLCLSFVFNLFLFDNAYANENLSKATERNSIDGWYQNSYGMWYYFEDGYMVTSDWRYIDGYWYFFHDNGFMASDEFLIIDGELYYFSFSGDMETGWNKHFNGLWCYMNSSGQAVKGWQHINNDWYYFDSDWFMVSDNYVGYYDKDNEVIYYMAPSGEMLPNTWKKNSTGWWYEFGDGGYAINTWLKIEGFYYHFETSGYMTVGWLYNSGDWYYYNSSGHEVYDWQKIDGDWYYFHSNGQMAYDTVIDGYYLGPDGRMQ